jgi:LytS/YehU family sensor histidine kinase
MGLLEKYLKIEKVRFKDKLQIHFNIAPECREVLVPNMILQPIVENAFKHGVSKRIEGSELHVEAHLVLNHLHISILNKGPILPEHWNLENSKGIGLSNTISRLKQLYGNDGDFNISNYKDMGVKVELYLPVQHAERPEEIVSEKGEGNAKGREDRA